VQLAFEEVRMAGARSPQVVRRLAAALEDLLTVAPPERHAPLERQLEMLGAAAAADDDHDLTIDLVGDGVGIGPEADAHPVSSLAGAGNSKESEPRDER
jgi:hypothetical protein